MNLVSAIADGLRTMLGVPAAVYALAALGLNLQFGHAGLVNVGQVGFMLVGAYGTAVTVHELDSLALGFLVGLAAAVLFGLLLGLTTLRLRAEYFAIATLATAEGLRLVIRSSALEPVTGGVFGLRDFGADFFRWNPIPRGRYGIGAVTFSDRNLWVALVGWVLVVLAVVVVRVVVRSPWGRVLRALRDDEDATRSIGKHVFAAKLQALVIGGTLGALGGILLSLDAQFVDPDFWVLAATTNAFVAMVLGGTGTIVGPVIGSLAFWFLVGTSDTLLRQALAHSAFDALDPSDAGPIRFALVGLALVLLVRFRPQGALGRRGELLDE